MKDYAKILNLEHKISEKNADEINEIISEWEEMAYRKGQSEMKEGMLKENWHLIDENGTCLCEKQPDGCVKYLLNLNKLK